MIRVIDNEKGFFIDTGSALLTRHSPMWEGIGYWRVYCNLDDETRRFFYVYPQNAVMDDFGSLIRVE